MATATPIFSHPTNPGYAQFTASDTCVIPGPIQFSALTQGSVPFIGASGAVSEDNDKLFFDATNFALHVGGNAPGATLHVTQPVKTTGSPVATKITGGAHTTLTASVEAPDLYLNFARTVQFSTGALAAQRAVLIEAPTYGFVGASTLTYAATVAITGAPVKGANTTLTTTHALLILGGAVSTAGTAYGLTVNAPTGAGVCYAAQFLGGGVGVGTATPTDPLTVYGPTTTVYRGQLSIYDSTAIATGIGGQITFGGKYTGTTLTEWASIHARKVNATDGQFGAKLVFRTRGNTGEQLDRVTILETGFTGVNTALPGSMFTVRNESATHKIVQINRAASDTAAWYFGADASQNGMLATNASDLLIGFDWGGTFTETMRVTTGSGVGVKGKVGINTTPDAQFHVIGATGVIAAHIVSAADEKGIFIETSSSAAGFQVNRASGDGSCLYLYQVSGAGYGLQIHSASTNHAISVAKTTTGAGCGLHVAMGALTTVEAARFGTTTIGTTQRVGVLLDNEAAAADGVQQYSPMLALRGQGWDSDGGGNTAVEYAMQVQPVQGATVSGDLLLYLRTYGGSYTEVLRYSHLFGSVSTVRSPQSLDMGATSGNVFFHAGGGGQLGLGDGSGGGYVVLKVYSGVVSIMPDQAPSNCLVLASLARTTQGVTDSHGSVWQGNYFPSGGVNHTVDWCAFTDVISDVNGASSWTLQNRLDAGSWYNRMGVHSAFGLWYKTHDAFAGSSVFSTSSVVQTTTADSASVFTLTLTDTFVYTIKVTVTSRNIDGTERGSWDLIIPCHREGAGAVLDNGGMGHLAFASSDNPGAWDVDVDTSGNDVRVLVTGEAGKTINWVAAVQYQGVSGSA